jgi:hypothetical protein
MTIITATSWNGTPFVYNRSRDTWQPSDEVTIGRQHEAVAGDMQAAMDCAELERALFTAITLDEYTA